MDAVTIGYGLTCILGAAFVRGYSGFGFSLLAITALSLRLAPAEIVPSIFLMEIAASLHLLPSIWRDIHWRTIGVLLVGYTVAVPFGVWLLASMPQAPMKVALGLAVLLSTLLLMRGFALKRMPGTAATVATGGASGLLNGAFGIGGPPVILFFFSSPAGEAIGRASVIAFFLATDAIGLVFLAREGLVTQQSFLRALIFLPALIAGIWLGAHSFKHSDQASFRRWVLRLLAVLAALTLAQGVAGVL
ncbi:MAG TPA: sulfite exporter TauE/SafE family protein [Methylomirabilota bacterium]|nr:sulfite exporter TauE/SafE family protein [Methylomirabilota bacterium]